MKSAVVFDLSPTAVRACLLDVAEGQCRFLAAGEYPLLQFGSESVAEDALGALAEVERLTGRGMTLRASPLTPEGGDGTGADVLAAVCSPAGRLRVAVVGADAALAYDAAARAVQTAGHDLVHTMVLGDEAIRVPGALHDSLRRLGRQEPDVILFATRDDRRLDKPLAQLGAALRALEALESPPSILFSGQAGAREALDQGLKGALVLKVLPELRPEQSSENLEPCKLALAALQVERWCATLPDFARFAGWLGYRPVDRDLALRNVVRYLSTSAVAAIRVLDCAVDGLGLWSGGPTLAGYHKAALGDRALEEWLPEELPTDDVAVVTANRHLRPRTVPADARERLFWGAEVRAGAQQASEDRREPLPTPALGPALGYAVISGSRAAWCGDEREAALLALDALQPAGVGYLCWDRLSLLAPLGALAEVEPRLAAEVMARDGLRPLGLYAAPLGQVRRGAEAIAVGVGFSNRDTLRMDVASGNIEPLPQPRGESVSLQLKPVGALDIGAGRGRPLTLDIAPTPLGLVVDARGRPLPARATGAEARAALSLARRQMGADSGQRVEP